ncbi:MAG TPA: ERF family protein [Chloroflexia bacterium]
MSNQDAAEEGVGATPAGREAPEAADDAQVAVSGQVAPLESVSAATPPPLSLFGKLARVAGRAAEVPRDGHNPEFKYSYATLGTVQAMLKPLLAAEGLVILPMYQGDEKHDTGTKTQRGASNILTRVSMTYRIVDSATGEMLDLPWLGEAMDFGDKGFAKALTISMRTFLNQLFQIPSYDEDTDPDRAAPQDQAARGGRGDRGERPVVQRRGSSRGTGNSGAPDGPPDRAATEIEGRLRIDEQGEPEKKRALRGEIRGHLERHLQLPEAAQIRLMAALTEGRGTKHLTVEQLKALLPKVKALQFSSEVWPIITKYEAAKEQAGGGGEELFEGAEQAQVEQSEAPAVAASSASASGEQGEPDGRAEQPQASRSRTGAAAAEATPVIALPAQEGD